MASLQVPGDQSLGWFPAGGRPVRDLSSPARTLRTTPPFPGTRSGRTLGKANSVGQWVSPLPLGLFTESQWSCLCMVFSFPSTPCFALFFKFFLYLQILLFVISSGPFLFSVLVVIVSSHTVGGQVTVQHRTK